MRFGADYPPSQHWWHVWLDFDTPGVVDGIRRDLDAPGGPAGPALGWSSASVLRRRRHDSWDRHWWIRREGCAGRRRRRHVGRRAVPDTDATAVGRDQRGGRGAGGGRPVRGGRAGRRHVSGRGGGRGDPYRGQRRPLLDRRAGGGAVRDGDRG